MGLIDQLELLMTVAPHLTDQVRLEVSVFADRLSDAVLLEVDAVPKVTDSLLLLASVTDQDFEAAAQSQVLAPTAEIIWLS